jgi:hypothetical protein
MMFLVSVLIFLVYGFLHISEASQCSELQLTSLNTNNDDNYSILTEQLNTSNIIKVSLTIKQIVSDTSWFIMGASDSSNLIGSWVPFTPADGQVIDCSSALEQAVTNENLNRLQFTFYWMAPPSFNSTVIFVATIFDQDTTSLRYIQSIPIQIEQSQGRKQYQDVNPGKFLLFISL